MVSNNGNDGTITLENIRRRVRHHRADDPQAHERVVAWVRLVSHGIEPPSLDGTTTLLAYQTLYALLTELP